jgi:hypothetical protein
MSINNIAYLLIVLHPSYKLDYFRHQKWPKEWIKEAEALVRKEWSNNYKPTAVSVTATTRVSETI